MQRDPRTYLWDARQAAQRFRHRRLKHIASIAVSNVDKKSADGEVPIRLCNYTDVYYNDRIAGMLPMMEASATRDQVGRFGLRTGDVLVTKDSETPDDIAVPAYVEEDLPDVVCGYHLALLRPNHGTDGRFLYWALASRSSRGQFATSANGITRFGLRRDTLGEVRLPFPEFPQQRAIADYLDCETARIDALVEKKQELLRLLDERRMNVMADGVSGCLTRNRLVPSTLPWLQWRGASWREARLTLVARLGSGHTPSRSHPEWWEDCDIPWITTGEVAQLRSDRVEFLYDTREKISELGLANSAAEIHPKDTVALSRTASAGYSGIMGTDMATSQDFVTWTCGPLIIPRFLLLCLRVMRQDLLGRLAMGSTHKTIYMPDLEGLRVPLPGIDEQGAIVDMVWHRLRKIDTVIEGFQRQINLLAERRQALITAAVTGELEVLEVAA